MKINILLALAFLSFIGFANIDYLHGIVGMTLRDGGIGCICHNFTPDDSVTVWIDGPDSVYKNGSQQYKIFMTGGAAVAGGFNIASNIGTLDSVDTLTHVLFGELTHAFPNQFMNDTVSWNFLYTAPDTIAIDTIYSVGNSVNWDSIPSDFDQWNFGENFAIHIIDYPVIVNEENSFPADCELYQNYPNPFNPSTVISYRLPVTSKVTLKVYDILGNEIATLVNAEKPAGEYEVEFSAKGGSASGRNVIELSSGIYLYQLLVSDSQNKDGKADNHIQTKKMILMK